MKTTIDLPDDLYRRVKARSALEGRAIRDVTIELFRRWLAQEEPREVESAGSWLDGWLRLGDETLRDAAPGPTATEILASDRMRNCP